MKLKKLPLILALSALLLGSIVAIHEMQRSAEEAVQPVVNPTKLFDFQEQDVSAIKLTVKEGVLMFHKQAASQPSSDAVWQMTSPQEATAEPGAIAYLLNLLATDKRQQSFSTQSGQLSEFGLDTPLATIDITLSNQKTHQLLIGKPNFNGTGLYAQVDPTSQGSSIVLISTNFDNAVKRPLQEWQIPAKP